jgi:thiopeptide-type bacteriocin biosynthesis protein
MIINHRLHDQAVTTIDSRDWLSLHLYSDQSYRLILLEILGPLLKTLIAEEFVDRFFFVRYWDEGGQHIRLRLRLFKAEGDACVDRFSGVDRNVCAVRPVHFEPETERYGGESVLGNALDFFSISSAHALAFESSFGDRPQAKKLTLQLCTLLWQAWGFAQDVHELSSLLNYFDSWSVRHQSIISLADEFFERSSVRLINLIGGELERLSSLSKVDPISLASAGSLSAAANALSRALSGLDPKDRWSSGSSQMHMMANRLGLTNLEESYVTRILSRSTHELSLNRPDFWSHISSAIERKQWNTASGTPVQDLTHLTRKHLEALQSHLSVYFDRRLTQTSTEATNIQGGLDNC